MLKYLYKKYSMNIVDFPFTFFLMASNIIISLIGFYNRSIFDKLILWPYHVKREKEIFRFITSGFLHADFIHLFFNMFTLYFFGRNIEVIFTYYKLGGITSYACLYFMALIISDIPSYLKHQNSYHYKSLGASGAVSAVVFATILFSPWESIYLYGAFKISALLYAVLFIFYCMYMDKKGLDNINHNAHLWGAIFGIGFTGILIYVYQPTLLQGILEQLKHPSLFGNG